MPSARIWQRLTAGGATPGGLLAWEIARMENGRPEWGIDIDETTIPQEANLEELHAISFTKGCYTGQEVVARIHFRGHVNRHLRGLRLGHNEPPPEKSVLLGLDGKQIGDVRSSALSPRMGAIALIMVRREVAMESTVVVEGANGTTEGVVVALPFVAGVSRALVTGATGLVGLAHRGAAAGRWMERSRTRARSARRGVARATWAPSWCAAISAMPPRFARQ